MSSIIIPFESIHVITFSWDNYRTHISQISIYHIIIYNYPICKIIPFIITFTHIHISSNPSPRLHDRQRRTRLWPLHRTARRRGRTPYGGRARRAERRSWANAERKLNRFTKAWPPGLFKLEVYHIYCSFYIFILHSTILGECCLAMFLFRSKTWIIVNHNPGLT